VPEVVEGYALAWSTTGELFQAAVPVDLHRLGPGFDRPSYST